MSFNATTEIQDKTVTITLSGELDAAAAPAFREEIEKAAAANPVHLVLQMSGLDYIASAGLRVLIFAKQKMGAQVDIYVVAPQEMVLETLQKTGFDQSVIIVDSYEVAVA
ncbi:MAG TPA: anti-sigma factor antagonist [Crinalium sp.]|jgi:anti-anti-sigma factor